MGYSATFSTRIDDIARNRRVYVESLNAFPDPVANVITMESNVTYIITKSINLDSFQFKVPDAGSVEWQGATELINPLPTSIANGDALFIGDAQRLVIREVDFINLTGAGKFYGLATVTATSPTLVHRRSVVTGFAEIGTLEGVFNILTNVVYANNSGGLNITNPNDKRSAILWDDISFVNQTSARYISISDNQRFLMSRNTVAEPSSGEFLFYLDSSLNIVGQSGQAGQGTALFIDSGFSAANGGDFLDPAGKDETDAQLWFDNNTGAKRSYAISSTGFTGNTTATVLSDTTTFVKINGTYIDDYVERFTLASGVGTYTGQDPIRARIEATVELKLEPALETDVIEVSLFVNGVEDANSRVSHSLDAVFQTPTSPLFYAINNIALEQGDSFEVRLRNTSNATNVTATNVKLTAKDG